MQKVIHWVAVLLVFGVPLALNSHAPGLDVTVGGILSALYMWAESKVAPTISVAQAKLGGYSGK